MTNALVLAPIPPESREGEPVALTPAQSLLRQRVLDSVVSPHSKRNYARRSTTSSSSVPADLSPGNY
jgi:hypothetical protein